MRVRYTDAAISDLTAIDTFVSERNPMAAQAIGLTIQDAIELLCLFPFKSRRTHRRGVRALPLSQYPYIIFFKIKRGEIEVLHILHGARRHPGFQEEAMEYAF